MPGALIHWFKSGLPPLAGAAWDDEHVALAVFVPDAWGRPRLSFCAVQEAHSAQREPALARLAQQGAPHCKAWAIALPEHEIRRLELSLPAHTQSGEVATQIAAALRRQSKDDQHGALCFDFHANGRAQDGAQSVLAYQAEREAVQHLCEIVIGAGALPAVIEPAEHSLARLAHWQAHGRRGAGEEWPAEIAQQRVLGIAAGLALRAFVPSDTRWPRINLLPGRAQRSERHQRTRRNALSFSALCGLLLGFALWGGVQSQWSQARERFEARQQEIEQRQQAQARRSKPGDWEAARGGWARFFAAMSQQTPAALRWQLWQQSGESITISGEARDPQAVMSFARASAASEAEGATLSKLSSAPGGVAHFTLHVPAPWLKFTPPTKPARGAEHHGTE